MISFFKFNPLDSERKKAGVQVMTVKSGSLKLILSDIPSLSVAYQCYADSF